MTSNNNKVEIASKTLFLLTNGLFSGASLYVSLVEHPARMTLDDSNALAQWVPSYSSAAKIQASLALVATCAGSVAYYCDQKNNAPWLGAALLQGMVIPYTLVALMPTNHQLQELHATKQAGEKSRRLLQKWGMGHAVRTVAGLAALAVSYYALFK